MLHTKFREICPLVTEKIFEGFLQYMGLGCGGLLGHLTQMLRTNFCSPYPRRLYIKFGFNLPSGFREDV